MATPKSQGKSKGSGPTKTAAELRSPPPPPALAPRPPVATDDQVAHLLAQAAASTGGAAVDALERLAVVLAERGEVEQAIWRLEQALRRATEGPTEPRLVARVALKAALGHEEHLGRLDRAIELLEQAHKLDPDQPDAIAAGRRIYGAAGDLARVARLYEVELETAPPASRAKRSELLVALANVLVRDGSIPEAALRLEQALPLAANAAQSSELREQLANLYAAPGFAERVDESEANKGQRRAAELFRGLALEHGRRGEVEAEIACYRRALGAVPDDLEAAMGLEAAYRTTQRIDDLARLYRRHPELPGALRRLAELAIAQLVASPPGPSPTRTSRLAMALQTTLNAANAAEPVDDLIATVQEQLAHPDDHNRYAGFLEDLLQGGSDDDPLDRADRLVAVAKHYKQANELVRFEAALLDALSAYPGHDEAFRLLSEHLSSRRDYATLVAIAEAALAAAPTDEHPARLEELAELYDKRLGDVAGALDAWSRRAALGRSERADGELRRLRVKEERWAGLVASLERELELAASSDARAEVLRRIGQIHRERHDLDKARAFFNDALELRPTDPSLYRTLGELAELEGRFEDLALLLRRQYKAAKDRVEKLNLLRRLAAAYDERLGDLEGVEWACEEILTHLPSDRDALRRLAQCHEAKGEAGLDALVKVLEAHATAAATPAEKIELYRRLARTYEASGQLALAAERWERLVRLDRNDAEASLALATDYEKLDRAADAALAYARVLEEPKTRGGAKGVDGLEPARRIDAWQKYARILDRKLCDPTRAQAAWEQLLALRPADREALSALAAILRQRGDARALEALLGRWFMVAEGSDQARIGLELARILRDRRALPEARARLNAVLASLGGGDLAAELGADALSLAVELADAARDPRGAIFALERCYFGKIGDPLEVSRNVAERWSALSPSSPATLLAWERVRALLPNDPDALVELSSRYAAADLPEQQLEIDRARLELAERAGDRQGAVALGRGLSRLVEDRIGDAAAAFAQLERVLGEPGEALHREVLDELRAIAERGQLWNELVRVLEGEPGLEERIERARLLEEKLRDPRRAFVVIRQAATPDVFPSLGPPSATAAALIPHLLRLGERSHDAENVLDALRELVFQLPRGEQARIFQLRAEVREQRMRDLGGALDELLRAVPLVEDSTAEAALATEIGRLARSAERYEDLLAFLSRRAVRAARGSTQRAAVLDEAAALAEHELGAPLRAFRLRLAALAQAADPIVPPVEVRKELWRLADVVSRALPSLEPTVNGRDSLGATEGRSRLLPLAAPAVTPKVRRVTTDQTMELDLREVVVETSRPRRDETMEIALGDLAEVARGAPPPRPVPPLPPPRGMPPPLPGIPQTGQTPVPDPVDFDGTWLRTAPALDQPIARIDAEHDAWEELAEVMLASERRGGRSSTRARLAVAAMWENGAQRVERALAELRKAFLEPNAGPEVRVALDAVAQRHGAEDELVAILEESVETTTYSERAVALLLDCAAIRERQGHFDEAEQYYRRILGMQPGMPEAMERLERYYRGMERWDALAEMLERRLNGLGEKVPSGEARDRYALELAEIYERLGKRYDAIATLEKLLERGAHPAALTALGRLYEAQGAWSRLIELLVRRIDLLEASEGSAVMPQARALRLRIAQIYENNLELPERALDGYRALARHNIPDPDVTAAMERLLRQLGHFDELADFYQRNLSDAARPAEDRLVLARKLAEVLRDHGGDPTRLLAVRRELVALRPDDDEALVALAESIPVTPETLAERIELGARRLQLAENAGAPATTCARLLAHLGTLEAEAGRTAEAIHTLEQAVALAPDEPGLLAQLAQLREGGEDWHGYADARERQAAVVTDDLTATRALIDAASAQLAHGERERAASDAALALARCPADAKLLHDLREVFRALDHRAQVVTLLGRELELAPPQGRERAELWTLLGTTLAAEAAWTDAEAAFRAAHDAEPGYAPAMHGLCDLATRTGVWDEVEPLLRYAASMPSTKPMDAAAFFRRIAEAASARGNADEAYAALVEADRRQPGDVRTRVQLGRNRFAQGRFREAAQHLSAVADHADLRRMGKAGAQALYEGAIAEAKIRRPEKAEALLKAALTLDPDHDLALSQLATQAMDRGDWSQALELLERQASVTADPAERARRWERVGKLILDKTSDETRARDAILASTQAWDAGGAESRPPVATLELLLQLQRTTNAVGAAADTAARLLSYSAAPVERARRLRESAALEAALGRDGQAREHLAAAHDLAPSDGETLAGYSALLVRQGDDEAGAQLLTRALSQLAAPTESERSARASLWQRLAEVRDRLGDTRGALAAFERVLELDPSRTPLRLNLLSRYGDDPTHEVLATAHRRMLLYADPFDLASLKALERAESRQGHAARAEVLQSLQAVAGALAVGRPIPLVKQTPSTMRPVSAPMGEAELLLLEHPDAQPLAEIFAAIYEGLPQDQLGDLASIGVSASARVSPLATDPAAELFAECARLFGNRRTALYMKDDPSWTAPAVVVRPPTAVVLSPALAALPSAELRFLLGRALWLLRSEHALVVGLPKERLNALFMSAVRAFHPRHAGARLGEPTVAGESDAQQLRKQLPYKIVKRLSELFQCEADTPFSSAQWRRGVEHSANRAGLVACGEFRAAARVLRDEGDEESLRELGRFTLSEAYLALRERAGVPRV